MSTLHFLPWCRLDRDYVFGDIRFTRISRTEHKPEFDQDTLSQLWQSLDVFWNHDGKPVSEVAILHRSAAEICWEKNNEGEINDLLPLIAFAALAERDYFQAHNPRRPNYATSSHFAHIRMPVDAISRTLRFDYHDLSGSLQRYVHRTHGPMFVRPLGCWENPVSINIELVEALLALKDQDGSAGYDRVFDALRYYNRSCSTELAYPEMGEVFGLLATAFESVLGARGNAVKLSKNLRNVVEEFAAIEPRHLSPTQARLGQWMRAFYILRSRLSHARRIQDSEWHISPGQHLLTARIVFPLLVKILLLKKVSYPISGWDVDKIAIVARIACRAFTNDEQESSRSLFSAWVMHMDSKKEKRRRAQLREEIRVQVRGGAVSESA